MYEQVSSRMEVITPRKAESLLRLNTFEGQRPLSNGVVQAYARAMAAGEFRRGEIAVAEKAFNGGAEVLVNGQHQLQACVAASTSFRAAVDRYRCPERDDLWKLFGTFDVHRGRTEQHVMKAARGLFTSEDLQAIQLRVLTMCGTALVFLGGDGIKPNFAAKPPNRYRKAELVQQNKSDVLRVSAYYDDVTHPYITTPVVTAMIATFRADPDHAEEFWDRVLWGDKLVKNSPQYKLRQKLGTGSRRITAGANGASRMQGIYSFCIAWWNSWKLGDNRRSVKVGAMMTTPDIVF